MKKILVVAAHPDDEILGCAGSVAKLTQRGATVETLILSGGKRSRGNVCPEELQQLQDEMLSANNIIGVKKIHLLDFPDNAFDSVHLLDIVKAIENIKKTFQPDIIFTHHFGDVNIDHQKTYQAVITATRPMQDESVKEIYSFEIPSSTEWRSYDRNSCFVANVFVDISESIEAKIEAMSKYTSELRDYPHLRSLEYIRALAKLNGDRVGLIYSENFELVRQIRSDFL